MVKGAVAAGALPSYVACAVSMLCVGLALAAAGAPPADLAAPLPGALTLDEAVSWALRNHPGLAAQRQKQDVAAAQMMIAQTYPFNPILENRVQGAEGPHSAGITNRIPIEHILLLEVEMRGQGAYRREQASAALSRTDWQIAQEEQKVAVAVMRAFTELLYRQEKLRLVEETWRFNERLVEEVRKLMGAGKLAGADLVLARAEAAASRDLVGMAKEAVLRARYDLYGALGVVECRAEARGTLELPPALLDVVFLRQLALERRADLRASQAAAAEAQSNLGLAIADRYGNPALGPVYGYDPSGVNSFGIQLNIPLPVFNTHRGEILQRQAQMTQAALEVRQAEVVVAQEVTAAVARLEAAQARAESYRGGALKDLEKGVEEMEKLFRAAAAGADLLRVIEVRRRLLAARDSYLDTLGRVSQARVDLVAAVGVPGLSEGDPPRADPGRAVLLPPESCP